MKKFTQEKRKEMLNVLKEFENLLADQQQEADWEKEKTSILKNQEFLERRILKTRRLTGALMKFELDSHLYAQMAAMEGVSEKKMQEKFLKEKCGMSEEDIEYFRHPVPEQSDAAETGDKKFSATPKVSDEAEQKSNIAAKETKEPAAQPSANNPMKKQKEPKAGAESAKADKKATKKQAKPKRSSYKEAAARSTPELVARGKKLNEFRLQHGWSQKTAAKMVGLSDFTVSVAERGFAGEESVEKIEKYYANVLKEEKEKDFKRKCELSLLKKDPARGNRLMKARTEKGLSPFQIARNLKINSNTTEGWEKGLPIPTKYVDDVCREYSMTLSQLAG